MRWLALVWLVAGCHPPGGGRDGGVVLGARDLAGVDEARADLGAADLGGADGGGPGAGLLVAGATDGTLTVPFGAVTLHGSGMQAVGAIQIDDGVGTVVLGGHAVPAVVYEQQPWQGQSLTLYQAIAVEPDRLHVLWFYCSGSALTTVYFEDTAGTPVTWETASGSCADVAGSVGERVQLPAMSFPQPTLLSGFDIMGPSVSLMGAAPGTVSLGGPPLTVLAFNEVDCSTGCGSPGWIELHALLSNPSVPEVCFAIFYLRSDDPAHVQLAYSLTLPTLTEPANNVVLPATWSTP